MNTVICSEPGVARSVAGMAAVSCVLLTKVVGRLSWPTRISEVLLNPEPFTVRVNAAPPTVPLAGESDVIAGDVPMAEMCVMNPSSQGNVVVPPQLPPPKVFCKPLATGKFAD